MTVLGELTKPKVDQLGPPAAGEFVYVDISSIDNKSKRIVEPKRLGVDAAPSRARQRLKAGDVLVSMTRPNLNAVAVVPPDLDGAVASTGFHVLRANEKVLPNWLYYGVQSRNFIEAMSGVVQGALYPAVRPRDIQSFDLPAPDVDEQRRIVAEIEKQFSRLDEAVANLQRVMANLKRYKLGVFRAAITGALLDQVPSEATPIQPHTLGKSARGWKWAQIGELADVVRGGSPRPAGDSRYFGGPVPWITVGPITADDSDYLLSAPTGLTEEGRERSRYVEPHTLLLTNSGATLGVPKITLIGGCINDGVAALLNVDYPLKRYLLIYLRTKTAEMRMLNQGAAQPNLNTSIIKGYKVPVPPVAEQHRIVAEVDRRLSIVRAVEAEVDANLKRAQVLRQAVLQGAFACKLLP